MFPNRKAFTLVEMLVALAVSSIVIIAAYASYDMVKTQYEKNIDTANMHTSGRAIMRIIERDIRMAGYEHRDSSGSKIFSTGIANPLVLSESNNVCCDGVSVIYDHPTNTTDGVERRRIAYSVREFPGVEEIDYELLDSDIIRYRLYKQIDIIGEDGVIFPTEEIGTEQVLADFVEDLQFYNINTISNFYVGYWDQNNVDIYNLVSETMEGTISNWFYTSALAFGPDGLLYSGSRSWGAGSVFVHDPSTRELVRTISGFEGPVDSLAFDSSGLLYVGYWDQNNVDIYNPVSETMEGTISNWFYTSALAFGPDGLLYSGSRGWGAGSVAVHDPSTREWVRTITGFEGPVDSLAFKNIATGNESLVNIKLTLRSKNKHYSEDTNYTKEVNEEHHIGNYNFEFNDKYKRDVFFSTVAVRNMLL